METDQSHASSRDRPARSRPWRGSLKLRMTLWFLAVALVPLGAVSAVSYRTARKSLRSAACRAVANNVQKKATLIRNWFSDRLIDLQSQASSVSNSQFLQELRSAYRSSGQNLAEFTKSYRWHTITDERSEDLKTFCKLHAYYDAFLIDDDGNILFTVAGESDLGSNLLGRELADTRFAGAFRRTLANGRPAFSDLEYYSPSNDIVAGFLAEVMVDEDGEKIGVFAIQVTPDQINDATRSENCTDRGIRAYVVGLSHQGDAVTLRSELIVDGPMHGPVRGEDVRGAGALRHLDLYVDTEQTRRWFNEHGPARSNVTDMDEEVFSYNAPDGTRVIGLHKDLEIAGVNWGLITEISEERAFAPANSLRNVIVALVFGTALVVAVIAVVITSRIVRPITRLSNAARRAAQGDLKQSIYSDSADEIGELARSFNGMVANLHNLFSELSNQKTALDEHAIVSITDIRGDIIYANDAFCAISGYSRNELLGQNHRLVKSEEHSPEFYRDLWLTISRGDVWHGEIRNRGKDGLHYWVDVTIVPFKNAQGKIDKYVAIRTDITRVKEAERKATHLALRLENTNLELEGQKEEYAAMNAELMEVNEALEKARGDAVTASRAKSDFLANMSHEIRSPMTAILGFSENLREGGLSEADVCDAVETIHRNGEYLLTIINDILDMSKIEAGKMNVESIPCSPLEIIEDAALLMKVRADAKNIALNTECVGLIPETVQSDPTRLKQILVNIIGNAIKFTDEGGVRLITRYVPENVDDKNLAPNQSYLQFDIIDTGVGMTEAQAGKLFQAFSQADSSTTRKFGGTGLGLTISKTFAEMLGGDITIVDTKPGCGTRFRTTVATGPLDGVKLVDPTSRKRSVTPPATLKTPRSDKSLDCRILLAEDGPDNQQLISFVLKKAGAEVTIAENGQIAVDLAIAAVRENHPFDVILMDMQMPVLDGYQATRTLRENNYDGPIIALTAHAMASDREKCINSGCDEFATKPIDRRKLISIIHDQLSRSPMPANA